MFPSLSLSFPSPFPLFFFFSFIRNHSCWRHDETYFYTRVARRFRLDYLQYAIRNRDIWTRIGPRSRSNIRVLYTPLERDSYTGSHTFALTTMIDDNKRRWWISMLTSRNYRGNNEKEEREKKNIRDFTIKYVQGLRKSRRYLRSLRR